MGFAASFRADAVGFRGGVWLCWDPLVVTFDIVEFDTQFIHAKGTNGDGSSFFITAVYASPRATSRVLLWDALKRLAVGLNDPWVVIGDFNSVLSSGDRVGGSPFNRARSKSFIETVDICGLLDIPFSGPKFTWSRNALQVRLDRALVNSAWIQSCPDSSVLHLTKIKSDHRPILLCPHVQVYSPNSKPFRFLAAWLSHASFKHVLSNKWLAGSDLPHALLRLTDDLNLWNKTVFVNIFKRKKRLETKLKQAEAWTTANPSALNRHKENTIRTNLELVLWQEELLWVQKSRANWLVDGDRNTRFFHLATLKRRSVNRIKRLKDQEGNWIEEQELLLSKVTEYFANFYQGSPPNVCMIDKRIRDFIWGSSEGNRRIHNVNWETVCSPKSQGGLGLRNARDLNKAFLMKLVWSLVTRPEELWAKVLISKYMTRTDNGYMLARKKGFSNAWRGIMKVWDHTQNGIHWSIRNGHNTKFWTDKWIDSGDVLIDHAINLQEVDPSLSVSDFCSNDSWDLQKLRRALPEPFVLQVYGMTPPRADCGSDCRAWGLEDDGVFSVKSAYYMLREIEGRDSGSTWKKIWKWEGPNKIRHFMWLLNHGKLMTNVERGRRRLTDNLECPHCRGVNEDLNHVFRECSFAAQTWNRVLPQALQGEKRAMAFKDWWCEGVNEDTTSSIFGFTLWLLWHRRNKSIFEDNAMSVEEITNQCSHQHSNLIRRFQELKSRQWDVTIEHIYREANFAADYLANSGHELELGTFVFPFPCNGLREWLRYDMLGVCLPRQVNNLL
ncbi:Putative ribonuclease H protein At1g65750 [Linum perenne]